MICISCLMHKLEFFQRIYVFGLEKKTVCVTKNTQRLRESIATLGYTAIVNYVYA